MKSRGLGILILATFSLSAAAMPHASLNQITQRQDENCNQQGSAGGFRDLITQVNIVAQPDDVTGKIPRDANGLPLQVDPRDSILTLGPKLGMSREDIARARETTGYVFCPGTRFNNPIVGSGALVGSGNQIITNVHLLIDKKTGQLREPLSECYFQNQGDPAKAVKLEFDRSDIERIVQASKQGSDNDITAVRIVRDPSGRPFSRVKPFPMDNTGSPLKVGQKLIVVTAAAENMQKKVPNTVPIVQGCRMLSDTMVSPGLAPLHGIFSDCAATHGASGSITLVRVNGHLAIRGVLTGGGSERNNYREFNIDPKANPDDQSYSYAAEIPTGLVGDINNFDMAIDNTRMAIDAVPVVKVRYQGGQGI